MRKPNIIFVSIVALVALLPHTPRLLLPEKSSEKSPEKESAATIKPSTPTQVPVQAVAVAAPLPAGRTAAEIPVAKIEENNPATEENNLAPQDESHPWDVLPIEAPVASAEPLAELEDAYLAEAFDPDWAAPLEESFHNVFDAVRLQDSAVEQAECRTTLCRFAITHKNSAAQDAFVQAFLQSRLLPLNQVSIAHHSHKTADGSIAAVYFLARNELVQVHN